MEDKKKLSAYITKEEYEMLRRLAKKYNRSISKQAQYMIMQELDKKEKGPQSEEKDKSSKVEGKDGDEDTRVRVVGFVGNEEASQK